jgi:hypothetical protein
MSRPWRIIYRVLGFFLAFCAYTGLLFSFAALFESGFDGNLMVSLFGAVCMVIYSGLARWFFQMAVIRNQAIKYQLKDWLIVNAIATIAIFLYNIYSTDTLLHSPANLTKIAELIQTQEAQNGTKGARHVSVEEFINGVETLSAMFVSVLIAHCVWTLRLVKKYKAYFQ